MEEEQDAARFYDSRADANLRGFIHGNERIERAWQTIASWAPDPPRRVLDLGCGIGEICWRASRRWPDATITGVDLSPRSISLAQALFGSPKLSFRTVEDLGSVELPQHDLILLVDVYEHIPASERSQLTKLIQRLASERTRVILTFPTAQYQAWLRTNRPQDVQPVDKDVHPNDVQNLANEVSLDLLLYRRLDVWRTGDYAHVVLGRPTFSPKARPALVRIPEMIAGERYARKTTHLLRRGRLQATGPAALVAWRLRRIARKRLVRRRLNNKHQ